VEGNSEFESSLIQGIKKLKLDGKKRRQSREGL
jgi:hypothetical protein